MTYSGWENKLEIIYPESVFDQIGQESHVNTPIFQGGIPQGVTPEYDVGKKEA
jgi:hypothetical protein